MRLTFVLIPGTKFMLTEKETVHTKTNHFADNKVKQQQPSPTPILNQK